MKIKEAEISNIKIHAHVYKSIFGEKLKLVSYKKSFLIPVVMLCSTGHPSSSLHLSTFN